MTENVDPEMRAFLDAFDKLRDANAEIQAEWEAMTGSQKRRSYLAQYFCDHPKGCPLLTIWQSKHGPAIYLPAYVLSPERNEAASNAAGRENHTTDGRNHWRAQVSRWVAPAEGDERPQVHLVCRNHVDVWVPSHLIQADINTAEIGKPVRRTASHAGLSTSVL